MAIRNAGTRQRFARSMRRAPSFARRDPEPIPGGTKPACPDRNGPAGKAEGQSGRRRRAQAARQPVPSLGALRAGGGTAFESACAGAGIRRQTNEADGDVRGIDSWDLKRRLRAIINHQNFHAGDSLGARAQNSAHAKRLAVENRNYNRYRAFGCELPQGLYFLVLLDFTSKPGSISASANNRQTCRQGAASNHPRPENPSWRLLRTGMQWPPSPGPG